jgi:ubiquinone/menaquinone biosynthesis C-methylase UbiE
MKLFYDNNYFEEYGEKYDGINDDDFTTLTRFLPPIPSDSTILELGCGSCAFGQRVKQLIQGSYLVGIDVCLPSLRWSAEPCCQGDAAVLPFQDQAFDSVLAAAAFHHFPSIVQTLSEAHRCLRKRGTFFCYEPNKYHPFRFICMTDPLRHVFYKTGDHCISPFWMKKKMEQIGFHDVSVHFVALGARSSSSVARWNRIIATHMNKRLPTLSALASPWFIIVGRKR